MSTDGSSPPPPLVLIGNWNGFFVRKCTSTFNLQLRKQNLLH